MNGRLLKFRSDVRPVRSIPLGLGSCGGSEIGFESRNRRSRSLACRVRSPVEELEMEGEDNEPSLHMKVPYGLGYSFTPGGLLVPYYIGVAGALKKLGLIGSETPVSGSSAGAICAALIASGLEYKDCLEANKRLQLEILQNGTFQKLHEPLRNSMMDVLPDDIHIRATGRIGMAVTVYRSLPTWKPVEGRLLDTYTSKSDLVDAIVASCYIPYYLGPAPGLQYRGEICSDGLPTNFFPEVIDSAKHLVQETVTVSAMPYRNRFFRNGPGVDISPDNRPVEDRFSAWGYIQRGILAYSLDDLELLAAQGYEDASNWGETYLSRRILERAGVL